MYPHWILNLLTINSWPHYMKGGRVFRTIGVNEDGERVTNVTRIITSLKDDSIGYENLPIN